MADTSSPAPGSGAPPLPAGHEPEGGVLLGDDQADPIGVFFSGSAAKMLEAGIASQGRTAAGLLAGWAFQGERRPFVIITGVLTTPWSETDWRPSPELWAGLDAERKSRYGDMPAVGWFMARSDGGIEFGPYERHIHRRHFRQPWQIGLIIDAQKSTSALYVRTGDKFLQIAGLRIIPEAAVAALAASATVSKPEPATRESAAAPQAPPLLRSSRNGSPAKRGPQKPLAPLLADDEGEPWVEQEAREFLVSRSHHPRALPPKKAGNSSELSSVLGVLLSRDGARARRRWLWVWLGALAVLAVAAWLWFGASDRFGGQTESAAPAIGGGSVVIVAVPGAPGAGLRAGYAAPESAGSTETAVTEAAALDGPGRAEPSSAALEPPLYVIRAGDTMWRISAEKIGDPLAYASLAQLNGIEDPSRIFPGDRLRLPLP